MTIRITGGVIHIRDYSKDDKYKPLIAVLALMGIQAEMDVESPCG